MIRLYDGRDENFELIGTIDEICDYMGFDRVVDGINDFHDLEQVIERDNGGMNYYHVEEDEEQEDEQEGKEIEPSWTEAYLNTLGLSMEDFL